MMMMTRLHYNLPISKQSKRSHEKLSLPLHGSFSIFYWWYNPWTAFSAPSGPRSIHSSLSPSFTASHHHAFTPTAACALRLFVLWSWSKTSPTVTVGVMCHFLVIPSDLADDVIEGVVDVDT